MTTCHVLYLSDSPEGTQLCREFSPTEKLRPEMVIGMQSELLDGGDQGSDGGQSSGLFSNEPFEKRPVTMSHSKRNL